MKLTYPVILISSLMMMGCQSLGEHLNCRAEVDRTVPLRTEQRYVRTDTKCVKSDQQSLGGGMGTIYNPGRGDVSCSSVPIYEAVPLNAPQRDFAYQQCRNRIANQGATQNINSNTELVLSGSEKIESCRSAKNAKPIPYPDTSQSAYVDWTKAQNSRGAKVIPYDEWKSKTNGMVDFQRQQIRQQLIGCP